MVLALARALTIKPHWAHLILHGGKTIENRTWELPRRMVGERVYIHTSQRASRAELEAAYHALAFGRFEDTIDQQSFRLMIDILDGRVVPPAGQIVGSVVFSKCLSRAKESRGWRIVDHFGWVMTDKHVFSTPVDATGSLNFWTVPEGLLGAETASA